MTKPNPKARVMLDTHHARTIALALQTHLRVVTERDGIDSPAAIAASRALDHYVAAIGMVRPETAGKALKRAVTQALTRKANP